MVFQGVMYWEETDKLHFFKFYDNSAATTLEYLQRIDELLLEWTHNYGYEVPLRFVVDVSDAGMFPIETVLTYSNPVVQFGQCVPKRYIAYISDTITDKLLFSRLAKSSDESWHQRRRMYTSKEIEAAREWLLSVG
jgi:hypothetical protein